MQTLSKSSFAASRSKDAPQKPANIKTNPRTSWRPAQSSLTRQEFQAIVMEVLG